MNATKDKTKRNRYLTYEDPFTKAGLLHQRNNLSWLIKEAYATDRTPLIPQLQLSAHHNWGYGILSDLGTYFDLDSVTIMRAGSSEPVQACWGAMAARVLSRVRPVVISATDPADTEELSDERCIVKRVDKDMSEKSSGVWSELYSGGATLDQRVNIPYSRTVIRESESVVRSFTHDGAYAAIHIRRGDKLQDTAQYTCPDSVVEYLKNTVKGEFPVYLLTNEDSPLYVSQINQRYPVKHFRDFRNLKAIVCKTALGRVMRKLGVFRPDNFLLYAIEMNILRNSVLQICTFKTPYSEYHLCPDEGWV